MTKIKIARELIAVIMITILFKIKPDMIDFNYTIFVSLVFISTIPSSNKESFTQKYLSIPAMGFYIITMLMIFGVFKNLSLEYILTFGSLTNIKAAKKILKERLGKLFDKNENKNETLMD